MPNTVRSDRYVHLLEELRAARERAGITQEDLAARLDVDQTYVSKSERGVRRLDVIELRDWVMALGLRFPKFIATLEERFERHGRPRMTRR